GCRGVSHYLEHLVLVGRNAQHEDQALRFFADGASNGWTTHAATGFSHSFPSGPDAVERLDRLFAFYGARLRDFSATPADAARERNVVRQEHDWRVGSSPYVGAARAASAFLTPDHPLGRWPIADPQTIAAYTVEEAQAFHARWYRRANVAFVVAGPIDAEALRAIAEQRLPPAEPDAAPARRDWLAQPPAPTPETRVFAAADARISEPSVSLIKLVPAPPGDHARAQAQRWLINEFLTSRLPGGPHADLVDRAEVARSLRRVGIEAPMQGLWQFTFDATPEAHVAPPALANALRDWLADFARRGLDEATLARLKQRYALAQERGARSAQSRAARLADWLAAPTAQRPDPARLADMPRLVAETTKAEIDAALAMLAAPGREAELHYAPAGAP
ncbi:MAG: insulinase family protein, partial [Methylobacteriaceae bacterium]|nr:insulinase family protein [Methylobacteriaceae bacterium]